MSFVDLPKSNINKTITIDENGDLILNLDLSVFIRKNMFTGTTNPTGVGKSKAIYYYTTVGFYDGEGELMAVGKVVEPLRTTKEIVLNFSTKYTILED